MSPGKRTLVWSYGGGTQSAALAVLVKNGTLPVPDLACIADTSREMPTTWAYLRDVIQPYLGDLIKIHIVPHEYARVDLYANDTLTIPAYTATGRFPTYCSGEWKRDACQRWLRDQGVEACDVWIGYSVDEMARCSKQRKQWVRHVYPLIDLRLTRAACYRIVEAAGLPRPPRSRCFMCPHQGREEWAEVQQHPELWKAAVSLDERIRENDAENALYLHSSRVPLAAVDVSKVEDEMPLFRGCQGVGCFT